MKSKSKRYILLALIVLSLILNACEEALLDQTNPNAVTTGSFWKTEEDFNLALSAVYSALQFSSVSGQDLVMNMLRSDLSGTESWYGLHLACTNFTLTDAADFVENRWSHLYIGIFRANQVLHYLEETNIPDFTDAEKTIIEAQVRFIRGINYFWLAHSFNGAVIHDVMAFTDEEMKKPFSPRNEVIEKMVIPDLMFAYENLPKKWDDPEDLGRVTWGAATAMLGKVYLYDKDWSKAAGYFKEIIDEADNSGLYRLTSDYMDNFTLEGEFNSESIFEVGFSDNYKPGISGQRQDDILGDPGSEATSIANAFACIIGAGGYNVVLPTYWLQELFVSGDTIDINNPQNAGVRYSRRTYATIAVEFGDGLYYNAPLSPDPVTGEASKANFNYGQGSKVKKFTNWYWKDSEDPSTQARGGINFRHIRLADVYLMYAEAILERDGESALDEAIYYIDLIRARAGTMLIADYMDKTAGRIPLLHKSAFANGFRQYAMVDVDVLMTHLRMVERPLELAFEAHRWYDLVRWGIIEETFQERREEEINIEEMLGNPIPSDMPKIYPLYLNERVRLDFIVPAASYNSEDHDYLPVPSVELQTNDMLIGSEQ